MTFLDLGMVSPAWNASFREGGNDWIPWASKVSEGPCLKNKKQKHQTKDERVEEKTPGIDQWAASATACACSWANQTKIK